MGISLQQNVNLKAQNTLGLDVLAEYFVQICSVEDLQEAVVFASDHGLRVWVLGGGSNLVLGPSMAGLCLYMSIQQFEVVDRRVLAGAGMNWHQFVMVTLAQRLFGFENLSLIPGQVGAAPIQNIGAYGVELSERVLEVNAFHLADGKPFSLSGSDCDFGYRHSVFKSELRDQAVITSVKFELDTEFEPRLQYNGISHYLEDHELSISAESVSEAVCAIRRSKLPDPGLIGNVGSFFKNPIVDEQASMALSQLDPTMPMHKPALHKQGDGGYKLSAAYLIESADLKGLRVGDAMVSYQHALVIQNEGKATSEEILELAGNIQRIIKARFDITLDIEPRILPN
ncbi:MAG: UDP-N-acetylmuramate dehydrogenase [Dinoroseobacter sp.]|jgi:UDP-N-acetylmuramate dehydrogenase